MSDVTLLRTLTKKSLMKFGYHRDQTVQEVILNNPSALVKCYFFLEAITFTNDILDELGIAEDLRISKPGKMTFKEGDELVESIIRDNHKKLKEAIGEKDYMNLFNSKRAQRNHQARRNMRAARVSLGSDTRRNHGHKK